MIITVFGTGSPTAEGYREAYELGKKIALAGHTLKNGGYGGTMEASAKGCTENDGRAIGICVHGHSFATEGKPNQYLNDVVLTNNLTDRVAELLRTDKIVVLTGKLGTLDEFFKAWAEMAVAEKGEIYLVGGRNKELLDFLREKDFIEPQYLTYVRQVGSIDDLDFL